MEQQPLRAGELFQRGRPIQIEVDGEPVQAYEGETIATALLASGRRVFRFTPKGSPRGLFCGMGSCFDCLVEADDDPSVRSCITPVREGMKVRTPKPAEGGGDI